MRPYYITFLLLVATQISGAQPSDNTIRNIVCITTLNQLKVEATFEKPVNRNDKFMIRLKDDDKYVVNTSLQPTQIDGSKAIFLLNNLKVTPWQPVHPKLYQFIFSAGQNKSVEKRIGFRMFESKKGNVYLNGNPIFLRGIAINPPGRGIPDSVEKSREFATDYVRFMKSINVNIIRIPNDETWYKVCDELGMMVFGGNYGSAVDGQKPPTDYDKAVKWYKEVSYVDIASHPSLMIYAMTNEVPYQGTKAEEWEKFLSYAHKQLREWDNTRLYIANAGYGYGKSGDICDLHRYWGWYYNSPFNFINIRDNEKIIPFKKKVQPITFTECVGNYTGPSGAYNLTPDHKNPGSQLNWTGHADWSEQPRLADEHQSFTLKTATELFRRLRPLNRELSGIFPFTIIFYNWNNVQRFVEMWPKPVTKQIKTSYQPLLVSWENYTPNVYAGSLIKPTLHIINDNEDFSDLVNASFVYELQDNTGITVLKDSFQLPNIKYYNTWKKNINISIPLNISSGNYELVGRITSGQKELSRNQTQYYIDIPFSSALRQIADKQILLYDKSGDTKKSLTGLKLPFRSVTNFNEIAPDVLLIIGENSADGLVKQNSKRLRSFMTNGGRVLCLRQDSVLFPNISAFISAPLKNVTTALDIPKYPAPPRPSRNGMYVNAERPEHPLFEGIKREQLRVWSDYTNWDESQPGFPAIYPVTDGYVPLDKKDIENIAVLGDYGVALEGIAIAEIFEGKGSALVCGMDMARRTRIDPVSDRLLLNMIGYMTDELVAHQKFQLITDDIVWGDYASEKGILTGVNSGLMVNAVPLIPANNRSPIRVTENGDRFLGASGGFNTRPGVQYVARGRRMFGPYFLRDFGNVPMPENNNDGIGEGYFWCRIPPGKTKCSTLVWNQADIPLKIKVLINDRHLAEKTIPPGSNEWVDCAVTGETVKVKFHGDRRLVLLQTKFH